MDLTTLGVLFVSSSFIILSPSVFIMVFNMLMFSVMAGLKMGFMESESIFMFFFLIIIVGGLMVSFLYMVGLCPNIKSFMDVYSMLIFMIMSFGLGGMINFKSESLNELHNMNMMVNPIIITLLGAFIWILVMVDYMISLIKGSLRSLL